MAVKSSTRTTWLVLACLVAGFLGFDLFGWGRACFSSGVFLSFAGGGMQVGQIVLIAIWAVFSSWNVVARVSWSLFLNMAIWYASILSVYWIGPGVRLAAVAHGLFMLTLFAVVAFPLVIAKRRLRWRLTMVDKEGSAAHIVRFQFQLWHLFLAITLLGIALTPLRAVLAMPCVLAWHITPSSLFLEGFVILLAVPVGIVCLWGALWKERDYSWCDAGWMIGSVTIVGCLLWDRCRLSQGMELILYGLAVCTGIASLTVFAILLIVRALGFRMIRAPDGTTAALAHLTQNDETPQE